MEGICNGYMGRVRLKSMNFYCQSMENEACTIRVGVIADSIMIIPGPSISDIG